MKLLHTGDLHIGKTVNDFSMLEDQKEILSQILLLAKENQVNGVILAGDIYDRAVPSGDAVLVFNDFLTALAREGITVYMISGNHDSPERISYGGELLREQGIMIAGVYHNEITVIHTKDAYGDVDILLLPFIKPSAEAAGTSEEAVAKALGKYWEKEAAEKTRLPAGQNRQDTKRRILVTHFFVTDAGKEPLLSDSETTIHVGGIDNVDASVFDGMDYVALGHIHRPQQIGNRQVYYAGSPLSYSFSEAGQKKKVLLAELKEKGNCQVTELPLAPPREMRKLEGSMEELLRQGEEDQNREDYVQAILTDQKELVDPMGVLRSVYPNVMQVVRKETAGSLQYTGEELKLKRRDPLTILEDFYGFVREEALTEEKKALLVQMIKETEE